MSASDKFATGIGLLLLPLNIALGAVQILAIYSGVQHWLGWHWFFCSLVATILVFFLRINLLNCIIGVLGAHYAWHWSWAASIALFFGMFALMIAIAVTAGAAEKLFRW